MISQTTEYALRAVVFLAQHADESWTTRQVAKATAVPAGYLSKVLQGLTRYGIVASQRGRTGGFKLARSPKRLTILQVVNAVEPLQRFKKCPLGFKTHGTNLCSLHRKLDDTIAIVDKELKATKVSDLLHDPSASEPLCDFPVALEAKIDASRPGRRGRRPKQAQRY